MSVFISQIRPEVKLFIENKKCHKYGTNYLLPDIKNIITHKSIKKCFYQLLKPSIKKRIYKKNNKLILFPKLAIYDFIKKAGYYSVLLFFCRKISRIFER